MAQLKMMEICFSWAQAMSSSQRAKKKREDKTADAVNTMLDAMQMKQKIKNFTCKIKKVKQLFDKKKKIRESNCWM